MQLVYFPQDKQAAQSLATQLNHTCEAIQVHRFPDQESCITLPLITADHVIVFLSLDHPNHKLIELMLACETLKQNDCQITLVAPYLCYMRQDVAFKPGDAVSQKIIGRFLSGFIDNLVTVDPHLHRTPTLKEAVPVNKAINLSSATVQAAYVREYYPESILAGPDEESEQWVSQVAQLSGLDYLIAKKIRHGDRAVDIQLPDHDVSGRHVILLDDIASTGHTLAKCAQALQQREAQSISAIVTHALFTQETEQLLANAGIDQIISTDSVCHPSNRIALAPLLATAVRELIA